MIHIVVIAMSSKPFTSLFSMFHRYQNENFYLAMTQFDLVNRPQFLHIEQDVHVHFF